MYYSTQFVLYGTATQFVAVFIPFFCNHLLTDLDPLFRLVVKETLILERFM